MDIHRAIVPGVGVAPHQIHQALSAVYPPGIFHQQFHQIVLLGGEVDGLAVPDGYPLAGVQRQVTHCQQLRIRLGCRTALAGGAPQQRPDAGLQLQNVEGLGDIVVGSAGKAHDLVGVLAAGGEHDDGNVGKFPYLHAGLAAGEAGHHQVQNDEVQRLLTGQLHGGCAVVGGEDLVALVLQIEFDALDQELFVVYYQYFHVSSSTVICCRMVSKMPSPMPLTSMMDSISAKGPCSSR